MSKMGTSKMGTRGMMVILLLMGALWGLTQPLSKIAVRDGYGPFGMVFWQLLLSALLVITILVWRKKSLPLDRKSLIVYLVVAVVGTIIPNSASYKAAFHLPAGVVSIVIATMAMFAFPMALILKIDRFSLSRLLGLVLGLGGVALIAFPEASLPDAAMIAFIPLALIAPIFYAIEGNYLAYNGAAGLDPTQLLCGSSIIGLILITPVTLATGQFISPLPPYTSSDYAIPAIALVHALAYMTYFWLVARAGAVFSAQVAYFVTGFGVVWSMLFLGERYSLWVWAALVLMLLGLALVQPRDQDDLAQSE